MVEKQDLYEMKKKPITKIEVSTWYGHPEPSIMQQHDGACFHKAFPMLPLGNWPIPPKERPTSPPCCVAMGSEHEQEHPIGPRHAQ